METGLNRQEIFSFGVMPSPNIPDLTKARQDLPLPDSRIGALEPSLYGTIIHAALSNITENRKTKQNKTKRKKKEHTRTHTHTHTHTHTLTHTHIKRKREYNIIFFVQQA